MGKQKIRHHEKNPNFLPLKRKYDLLENFIFILFLKSQPGIIETHVN